MLKVFPVSLDENNDVCPYIQHHHYKYYDVTNLDRCDFIGIYLRFSFRYKFNDNLFNKIVKSKKPWILFDYLEYGAPSWHDRSVEYRTALRIFGYKYVSKCGDMRSYPEFVKLVENLESQNKRIKCYFLRESFKSFDYSECPFPVYPVDYCLAGWDKKPIESLEEFSKRPIELLYNWGNTNHDRMVLHHILYKYGTDKDWNIAETEEQLKKYLEEKNKRIMVLWHRDHHERIEFKKYLPLTKLCVDVGGCGIKCFRNMQSSMYCASIKQLCGIQFAYPWIPSKNCLELEVNDRNRFIPEKNIETIEKYLNDNSSLYEIYKEGVPNAELYDAENYINNYISPKINEYIKR